MAQSELVERIVSILERFTVDDHLKMSYHIAKKFPETFVSYAKELGLFDDINYWYAEALRQPTKIDAIKKYRELTGADLKTAKEWADKNYIV